MRGSLRQRGLDPRRWTLILDTYVMHPVTRARIRKRRWISFTGTKRQAETKLNELVTGVDKGEFVESTKITLGQWLDTWLTKAIVGRKAANTVTRYRGIVEQSLVPKLGAIRLRDVTTLDIESYYAGLTVAAGTAQIHHAILSAACKSAVKNKLLVRNVAAEVEHKPKKPETSESVTQSWTEAEARQFLVTAKAAGPQMAALFSLALDTGARRGELGALRWQDVDLDKGRITISQTLLTTTVDEPTFGPTKTKTSRTLSLSPQVVALLRTHRQHQAEIRMMHRQCYREHDLVFAKEADSPGGPLQWNNVGTRMFAPLCRRAGVRVIRFHDLRHTMASLLLAAREPAHLVQRRLGHSKVEMTLTVYAHVLNTHEDDAVSRHGAALHG